MESTNLLTEDNIAVILVACIPAFVTIIGFIIITGFTRIDFTKTNSTKINSGYLEEYVFRTVKGTEYAGQGDQKAGEICRAYIWQKTNRKNIADLRGS